MSADPHIIVTQDAGPYILSLQAQIRQLISEVVALGDVAKLFLRQRDEALALLSVHNGCKAVPGRALKNASRL